MRFQIKAGISISVFSICSVVSMFSYWSCNYFCIVSSIASIAGYVIIFDSNKIILLPTFILLVSVCWLATYCYIGMIPTTLKSVATFTRVYPVIFMYTGGINDLRKQICCLLLSYVSLSIFNNSYSYCSSWVCKRYL